MSRKRKYVVPGAEKQIQAFKAKVMEQEGYHVDHDHPDDVKFEIANELGITLKPRDNGDLSTEEAGHIGGKIGGSMVREMIRMAQERLSNQK